jgi:hypothetical protein
MKKLLYILQITFLVSFVQCNGQKNEPELIVNSSQKDIIAKKQYLNDKIKTDSCNIPLDSNAFYFPIVSFSENKNNWLDTFTDTWYSKMLFALQEPLLYNKTDNKISFRFTWLRTFHNPIAIRIENNNHHYKLYWKKSSGAGGYKPGKLTLNKSKEISEKEWNKFIELVNKANFWDLPTDNNSGGLDGSEWILEGTSNEYYHFAFFWSPRGGNFYDCCNYLISLTDLSFENDPKY